MIERHLREIIQKQADKLKELEANLQDYSVKWDLKNKKLNAQFTSLENDHNDLIVTHSMAGKRLTTLENIQKYLQDRLKKNKEFQQVIRDLKGGFEEEINFECLAVDSDCTIQCNECKNYQQ
jgi:ribosome-associated translation inhibitor RaiA